MPGQVYDFETASVWTRKQWSDPWQFRPDLFCKKCTKSVGGAIGSAAIGPYRYAHKGKEVKQFSTDKFHENPPLEIDRHYVKIEWNSNTPAADPDTKVKWYGIITNQDEVKIGTGIGNQTWEARSLEWLFTRIQITTSKVESLATPGTADTVERAITFNAGSGEAGMWSEAASLGNRNTSKIGGYYVFDNNLKTAALWTAADIAEYLFEFHWDLSVFSPTLADDWADLAWYTPTVVADGRTMYDVLQQLVDPKRGVTWSAEMNNAETELVCTLHTFTDIDITLPQSGSTLSANSNIVQLDGLSDDHTVDSHFQTTESQRKYEQVTVQGARKGVCMSFSFDNGDLFPTWGTTQQSLYNISNDGGNTTVEGQKNACDNNRQKDSLKTVYREYAVDTVVIDTTFAEKNWHAGLRLNQHLPLLEFHDYSSSASTPSDNTPTGTKANFRKMFATVEVNAGESTVRAFIDRLNANAYTERTGDGGIDFACSVRPKNDAPAFELVTHSIPHVLGKDTFSDASCPTEVQPQIDYRTMACTCFIERDSHVTASWPATPAAAVNDMQSVLYIRLGNKARQDRLLVGTILDIDDNGDHITAASSGMLRDDSDWMEDLARSAYTWYATPRRAIHLVVRQFSNVIPLGAFITDIDGVSVNSVVTSVTWDHEHGTTTVRTSFADLDFALT